jgi:alpha-tubulin suppressor-like RCC1 family protein
MYAAALCALLGAGACSDDNLVGPSRAVSPREAQREISVSNPAISLLSVEVGGGKTKYPLLYNLPLVDGWSKSALTTPAAEGRQLVVRGYDVYGTLTHQGSVTVEAIRVGRNEPLNIVLAPTKEGKSAKVSIDIVGEELSGGGSIVVEAPKEIAEGQRVSLKAHVYDRKGRQMDVDPADIHWAVSDPRIGKVDIDEWSQRWIDASRYGVFELVAIYKEIVWRLPIAVLADPYVQIAAGFDFTCGRRSSGAVSCWGDNATSQLGAATTQTCFAPSTTDACSDRPVAVSGGRTYKFISSGRGFVCGIETTDRISCWGRNDKGQLGNGGFGGSAGSPTSLNNASTFTSLTTGGDHSCAIVNSAPRQALCWGWNGSGQLGDNNPGYFTFNPMQQTSPVAVFGGFGWKSIAAGREHTCGITTTGEPRCWGPNYFGELGTGPVNSMFPTPAVVNTPQSPAFNTVFSGANAYGTCWLRVGPVPTCHGANDSGQVAIGFLSPSANQPATMSFIQSPPPSFMSIALGSKHTCAVDDADNLWCWGGNSNGQVGFATVTWAYLFRPKQVGAYKFSSVTAGANHTCGLTRAGDVFCWGKNDRGQLGIGSHGSSTPTPTLVVP